MNAALKKMKPASKDLSVRRGWSGFGKHAL